MSETVQLAAAGGLVQPTTLLIIWALFVVVGAEEALKPLEINVDYVDE